MIGVNINSIFRKNLIVFATLSLLSSITFAGDKSSNECLQQVKELVQSSQNIKYIRYDGLNMSFEDVESITDIVEDISKLFKSSKSDYFILPPPLSLRLFKQDSNPTFVAGENGEINRVRVPVHYLNTKIPKQPILISKENTKAAIAHEIGHAYFYHNRMKHYQAPKTIKYQFKSGANGTNNGATIVINLSDQLLSNFVRAVDELFADLTAVLYRGNNPRAIYNLLKFPGKPDIGFSRDFSSARNEIHNWKEIQDLHDGFSPVRFHLYHHYIKAGDFEEDFQKSELLEGVFKSILKTIHIRQSNPTSKKSLTNWNKFLIEQIDTYFNGG